MLTKTDFYIDGEWVAPVVARPFELINPANEMPAATISLGSQEDLDKAVAAARAAFASWGRSDLGHRVGLIKRLLEIYKARAGEMAEAITTEMGAPISFALSDQVGAGIWHMEGFLDAVQEIEFDRPLRPDVPNERILREPVGVCGLITPWNWPMNQVTLKVVPALLAGCTVILKPSEIAPLSSMLFAEMMHEAGAPKGVFNLVNGDGAGVGSAMSAHPGIDLMSFTGSTRAGIAVSKAAADTVKRVALELGGKSPNIIFADAELERAVKKGVRHCMENTGQSCNAPTRMLVEESVYEDAIGIAKATAEGTRVGDPAEEGRHIGPLVSQAQFDKVQELIEAGIAGGARLVTGGAGRPQGFNRGYYARPTVFADVTPEMQIWREEIFGPVLAMTPFKKEDEAIRLANDTPYGLAAYLSTSDAERARRVGGQLRAGMVRVNNTGLAKGSPFGGYKQSGIGREGGVFGIEEFLETKTLALGELG
ncbi:aldehyde dehydrogenase family protein [Afifella sp. IM 167]|uniref:aldehyde dehydrogenase family protein n=1 Tax=Afifella sp. IM 167 TaxID=2033586 RepID=UPI001CCE51DB|nr:aldehyde dehydrogenase family protein [Afifella sp. IM 167]MBZ8132499.1 aldehyde dehydrogenase family protein [Afifella sp. IM 167]